MASGIILFEFEIPNKAFNQYNKERFENYSFIENNVQDRWSRYDAIVVFPQSQLFMVIESKLNSDISYETKHYWFINQVIRNLEAAYMLTHHVCSEWKDWDYRYILLCPRRNYELKTRLYSYYLTELQTNTLEVMLRYRQLGCSYIDSKLEKQFRNFQDSIHSRINVVYWDQLYNAYSNTYPGCLIKYLNLLEATDLQLKKATINRLKIADIPIVESHSKIGE